MKKIIALALALTASSAYAIVSGTPHDLSAAGNGVCRYCHTPHHSNPAVSQAPIWARTIPTGPFTVYTKYAANLATTNMSLLCMSCHDGVTTLGTMYGTTLSYNTSRVIDATANTGSNLGLNLQNDHPVGIIYNTAITSVGLVAQTTAVAAGFIFFDATGATGGNYMECGTCHDPHSWSSVASAYNYKFKRSVTGDFCAACHGNK